MATLRRFRLALALLLMAGCDATRPVADSSDYRVGFEPSGGTYANPQTVTLTRSGVGDLCYTTMDYEAESRDRFSWYSWTCVTARSATVSVSVDGQTTLHALVRTSAGVGPVQSATYLIRQTAPLPAPVFGVASGQFSDTFSVALSCSHSGARIYYTFDAALPVSSWMPYSGKIAIRSPATLKAIAVADGWTNSPASGATYDLKVAPPSISTSGGQDLSKNRLVFSTPQTVAISCATRGASIHYTHGGRYSTASSTAYTGPFTVDANDTIIAIATRSDLPDGDASYSELRFALPPPLISPSRATFSDSLVVAIADTTARGSVRYTLDGTVPTSGSTLYSGPITIRASTIVRATTVRAGYDNSPVASASFAKTIVDSRDGATYPTVRIGSQTWMARNLAYVPDSGKSWCPGNSSDSCIRYGRLYDWATAQGLGTAYNTTLLGDGGTRRRGACLQGWHLPTISEWHALLTFVDSSNSGARLKSVEGWASGGNGSDAYGFGILPAGMRYPSGSSASPGYYSYMWVSDEFSATSGWAIFSSYGLLYVDRRSDLKTNGYSIRCVQD